jgi:hypothetical protein
VKTRGVRDDANQEEIQTEPLPTSKSSLDFAAIGEIIRPEATGVAV